MGFRVLVSLHPAIQATGRLTLAPAGLPPAEHTSLHWTHNRTRTFGPLGLAPLRAAKVNTIALAGLFSAAVAGVWIQMCRRDRPAGGRWPARRRGMAKYRRPDG